MYTLKQKIKIHQDREKASVTLAKAYAKSADYNDAAKNYLNAAFHRSMADELKSVDH